MQAKVAELYFCGILVEFGNNIKTPDVNLLNKAFEYNLKYII